MIETEIVACDYCGSTEQQLLYELADEHLNLPGKFALRRCSDCDVIYLSPRPSPASMRFYYPDEYENYQVRAVEDEPFCLMRWMRRSKLARKRRFVESCSDRESGTIVDVGCSTGLFLREMQVQGWHVSGVEPSATAAAYASERFGIEVIAGNLLDTSHEPGSVDVVTFWDVLEHTYSPKAQLGAVASWLRPGGGVALSVPNWKSFDRRLFGRFWQGLDTPRHLFVFEVDTLSSYLSGAGFEVTQVSCFEPGYFAFAMSLDRWLHNVSPQLARVTNRILSVPGFRMLFVPWFWMLNALGCGSTLSMYARKVD